MKVYKLNFDAENFRPVGPVNPTELDNDQLWLTGDSKKDIWQPPAMNYATAESAADAIADISWLGPGFYVFNKKAIDALSSLLNPAGELLPITVSDDPLEAFNPTNLVDCLDQATSQYNIRRNGNIGRLLKPSIDTTKLHDLALFRTPEAQRNALFATEVFKQAYDTAGLIGLIFEDCTKTG